MTVSGGLVFVRTHTVDACGNIHGLGLLGMTKRLAVRMVRHLAADALYMRWSTSPVAVAIPRM